MINSKGAFQSFNNNNETSTTSDPHDGTFQPAMDHLRTWATVKDNRRKGLVVAFANFKYTEKADRQFPQYPHFSLPNDVGKLMNTIFNSDYCM